MKHLSNSLIISTYNWPEALHLVLKSLKQQSVFPDEVLIADDGSTSETKSLIETFNNTQKKVKLIHVWHEDNGFRKSEILNKAIAKARGDYIIQVDGDCIMHQHFIKDHLSAAKKGTYLFGSRVNIQKSHLSELFQSENINFNPFSKGIKKRTRAIHAPILASLYKSQAEFSKKYRGCNTSYFKSDFVAVNGYNEDITGWGREDSEFALRLHNNDVLAKRLRYKGIVFHIFHVEKSKDKVTRNTEIQRQTIKEKIIWTKNGVDKYLDHA